MPSLQTSLFDAAGFGPALADLPTGLARTHLGRGAWIDYRPNWLNGSEEVFRLLLRDVDWRAEEREMYERVVTVPRLLAHYGVGQPLPHPWLTRAKNALDSHYGSELGEAFATAGLCLYRDGHDSVAWHGDRIGRSRTEDTMVAILSLGEQRKLLLRPREGGASRGFLLGHGDLLVMGGSCQRTFDHAVPKTVRSSGPRISVQFRPRGVL